MNTHCLYFIFLVDDFLLVHDRHIENGCFGTSEASNIVGDENCRLDLKEWIQC